MINKKLAKEVLGLNVEKVINENTFRLHPEGQNIIINIHELAHKCKEWADKKGFLLESGLGWCNYYRKPEEEEPIDYIMADTEPEAIFKATQYILDNLKKD